MLSDIALKDEYLPRPTSDEEILDYNMPLLPCDVSEELQERRPITPFVHIRTIADAAKFLKATEMTPCHESLIPSKEWIYFEADKYRELRHYVEYLTRFSTRVPSYVQREEVCSCSRWDWEKIFETKKPRLSLLLTWRSGIIETGLIKALDMVYDIPHGQTMDTNLGQWIYALLVCVIHVDQDLLATLRKFTRQCARLSRSLIQSQQAYVDVGDIVEERSYIDHEDKNALVLAAPYSLFICIVNKHYKQHDIGF